MKRTSVYDKKFSNCTSSCSTSKRARGTVRKESHDVPVEVIWINDSPERGYKSLVSSDTESFKMVGNVNIEDVETCSNTATADLCEGLENINWLNDSLLERVVQRDNIVHSVNSNENLLKNTEEKEKLPAQSNVNSSIYCKGKKTVVNIFSKNAVKYSAKDNGQARNHNESNIVKGRNSELSTDLSRSKELPNTPSDKSFFGLPSSVKSLFEKHKGISSLYEWQVECLNLNAVKEKRNLIYALPTSGGKTLVAEVLILRELLCFQKNVLFVLPYISIVQEKVHSMTPFALSLQFLVEEYAAGKGRFPPIKRRCKQSVYIATMEKAHTLISSLIETHRLSELGLIIVDELHLLGERDRGATLECLLTKVLFCPEDIQIVGMSATIGNLQEIAKFLQAEIYCNSFRPVKLNEYVKYEETLWAVNYNEKEILYEARKIKLSKDPIKCKRDPDGVCELVLEIVPQFSCLVFCQSKKNCENVASMLVDIMPRSLLDIKTKEREALLRALRHEGTGNICPILRKSVLFGVAYHHSGLTGEERKLLEEAYRAGTLDCICCTSTLAAGVNLPAKRVILRAPFVGSEFITLSQYKQMAGRAGRAGFDNTGESILMCKTYNDVYRVQKLLCSQMNTVNSNLHLSISRGLPSLILSAIGLGIAVTRREIDKIIACSLLSVQSKRLEINITEFVDSTIQHLSKFLSQKTKPDNPRSSNVESSCNCKKSVHSTKIRSSSSTGQNIITQCICYDKPLAISRLGKACMKGPIDLKRAFELYKDLKVGLDRLVTLSYLHLLYLITPYDMLDQIKVSTDAYYYSYNCLNQGDKFTADVIGISEACIVKMKQGQKSSKVPERVFHRFYLTLILNDVWNKNSVWSVADKYSLPRGTIQNLMVSASTFASCVIRFCEELEEFWAVPLLFRQFAEQLSHCCIVELLPLLDLPAVKVGRARQLYNAGFKTLQDIVKADVNSLVQSVELLSHKVAAQIQAAAAFLLLSKAEDLRDEAADVMDWSS